MAGICAGHYKHLCQKRPLSNNSNIIGTSTIHNSQLLVPSTEFLITAVELGSEYTSTKDVLPLKLQLSK